jgi:hypothetical protein
MEEQMLDILARLDEMVESVRRLTELFESNARVQQQQLDRLTEMADALERLANR